MQRHDQLGAKNNIIIAGSISMCHARWAVLVTFVALWVIANVSPVQAQTTNLTIMVFQGMQNLPLLAAQSQAFFAKRGLKVDIRIAPDSDELREGLAHGRYQIVHAGVDNAVAMAEVAKVDIAIVMGGDNGFNRLVVQPEIKSYADLRGKTVIVDAPDTAFAFLMYEMLRKNGLNKGDYEIKPVGASFRRLEVMLKDNSAAAAMLNMPFTLRAAAAGLGDLGSAVEALGPYQGTGAFVLRKWAAGNSEVLVRYMQAYIEGLRWGVDPKNRDQAIKLYVEALKLNEAMAARTLAIAAHPTDGLTRDARLDAEGFKNVLALRANVMKQWAGSPPAPEKYLDGSYYAKALAGL
jgi:ABC-type nitrate/sulfonate/bicarbonate transport system substrate-binding protein